MDSVSVTKATIKAVEVMTLFGKGLMDTWEYSQGLIGETQRDNPSSLVAINLIITLKKLHLLPCLLSAIAISAVPQDASADKFEDDQAADPRHWGLLSERNSTVRWEWRSAIRRCRHQPRQLPKPGRGAHVSRRIRCQ